MPGGALFGGPVSVAGMVGVLVVRPAGVLARQAKWCRSARLRVMLTYTSLMPFQSQLYGSSSNTTAPV